MHWIAYQISSQVVNAVFRTMFDAILIDSPLVDEPPAVPALNVTVRMVECNFWSVAEVNRVVGVHECQDLELDIES